VKTLRESWGSEVKFTQHLATDLEALNRINDLIGVPRVCRAANEYAIPGGSIDVVGFTVKGHAVIYEHQDQSGRADQTHVSKTATYAHQIAQKGTPVLGAVLLCESVDNHYLEQFRTEREEYLRRKRKGYKNLHFVRSQWSDLGEYRPVLFDTSTPVDPVSDSSLEFFEEFVAVYAADWMILREESNGAARTLWHRVPGMASRFVNYVHVLKGSVKVGMHCVSSVTDEDRKWIESLAGGAWRTRTAQDRATVEYTLDSDSSYSDWADRAEELKRKIRASLRG